MNSKLLALVGGMLLACGMATAQPVTGNVTAVPLWTDTGIYITNTEAVNVNASGFWYWGYSVGNDANDPDGILDSGDNHDAWIMNNIHGSLIAFVGENPYYGSQWTNGDFQTNEY
jgi:hypothetical protein